MGGGVRRARRPAQVWQRGDARRTHRGQAAARELARLAHAQQSLGQVDAVFCVAHQELVGPRARAIRRGTESSTPPPGGRRSSSSSVNVPPALSHGAAEDAPAVPSPARDHPRWAWGASILRKHRALHTAVAHYVAVADALRVAGAHGVR